MTTVTEEFRNHAKRKTLLRWLSPKQRFLFGLDCAIKAGAYTDLATKIVVEKGLSYIFDQGETKKSLHWHANNIHEDSKLRERKSKEKYLFLATCCAGYDLSTSAALHASRVTSWQKIYDLYLLTKPTEPFPEHYRTPETLGIAREIIQKHNLTLLPILADALMDFGCDDFREGGYSSWALYYLGNT